MKRSSDELEQENQSKKSCDDTMERCKDHTEQDDDQDYSDDDEPITPIRSYLSQDSVFTFKVDLLSYDIDSCKEVRGSILKQKKLDGGVYSAQGILHWKMNTGGTYQSTFHSRSGEKKQIGYITESILREKSTINSLKMKLNSLERNNSR